MHLLTEGAVGAAASSNLLVVVSVPFAVAFWLLWVRRSRQRRPVLAAGLRTSWLVTGAIVLVVFTVLRNLPAGAWLAS